MKPLEHRILIQTCENWVFDVGVIMFSSNILGNIVERALNAGAFGYVLKDAAGTELVEAVRSLHAGKRYLKSAGRQISFIRRSQGETDKAFVSGDLRKWAAELNISDLLERALSSSLQSAILQIRVVERLPPTRSPFVRRKTLTVL